VAAVPHAAYQWYFNTVALKDGADIAGATAATLTVSARASSSGPYTVTVDNSAGKAISITAILSLRSDVVIPPFSSSSD
jgi:hypothetical protein